MNLFSNFIQFLLVLGDSLNLGPLRNGVGFSNLVETLFNFFPFSNQVFIVDQSSSMLSALDPYLNLLIMGQFLSNLFHKFFMLFLLSLENLLS